MALSRHFLLRLPSVNAIRVWTRPLSVPFRYRFALRSETRPSLVMANVTKANFWETSELLKTHLQEADFVAIDFEMTGVETAPWRRHSEIDTCETRYQQIKNSAESFALWQCGVCPFKWDETGQKFIAYPYNFYLFPRKELPVSMPARDYFCQTSSLEFLAKHHFDFNATVYNGISYLSLEQEDMARAKLGLSKDSRILRSITAESEFEIPLTKTGDVVFSERVRLQVGQWRDGILKNKSQWHSTESGLGGSQRTKTASIDIPASGASGIEIDSKSGEDGSLYLPEEEITSDDISSRIRPSYFVDIFGNYQARLVKQVLRKHYRDLLPVVIFNPSNEERKQVQIFFSSSKEDKERLEEELEERSRIHLEDVLSKAVGFRKIIDIIVSSGKPLVGHNCLLDLAHLHDKFFGTLPPNIREFSASVHNRFPCILDTKYLLKTEPTLRDLNVNKGTSLAIVYQEFCQGFSERAGIPGRFYNGKPKIFGKPMSRVKLEIASELQRYSGGTDTGLKHEAGFDAYMTGAVFAQLCHILRVDAATIRALPQAVVGQPMGFASYANLLMLQTFRAQVALDLRRGMEAVGVTAPPGPTIPAYRLPRRENVALVWGFCIPAKDQEKFLKDILQTVFAKERHSPNADIYSIDESSAFLEFKTAAILDSFFEALHGSLVGVTLSSGSGEDFTIKASKFGGYERICKSPLATPTLAQAADLLGANELRVSPVHQTGAESRWDEDQKEIDASQLTFEVGSWEGQTSEPVEQVVIGETHFQGLSIDTQSEKKPTSNPNNERPGAADGIYKDGKNTGSSKLVTTEPSYSKRMKRGFDEKGQVVGSPLSIDKLLKRPRVGEADQAVGSIPTEILPKWPRVGENE